MYRNIIFMWSKFLTLFLILFCTAIFSLNAAVFLNSNNQSAESTKGKAIFIQIFKQEKVLELYAQDAGRYKLVKTYPICNYSGGLGPKKRQGDYKSPEGFYEATYGQLKPNSEFHRAINLGYPNQYDMYHGYSGDYLMIHGDCVSVGCYAMQNGPMEEIYNIAEAALQGGQSVIPIHIYPFRMTSSNLAKHKHSVHYEFWQDLAKGYEYFQQHNRPANVWVNNGRYVINQTPNANTQLADNRSINTLSKNNEQSKTEKVYKNTRLSGSESGVTVHNKKVPSLLEEAALLQSIQSAQSR